MQLKKDSGLCSPTKSILPSPVTAGYRNKCGFTIGKNLDGEVDVGFRLGKYRYALLFDGACSLEYIQR